MKLRLIGLLAALGGPLFAQNLRVTTQVIEVPHAALTAWTSGAAKTGPEMHRLAWEQVEKDRARVVDTSIVTGRLGERILNQSITECIYPMEPEPRYTGTLPLHPDATSEVSISSWALRYAPTCFDTRNAGISLEVGLPEIAEEAVDLAVGSELVGPTAPTEWKTFRDEWGDASIRFPTFRTREYRGRLSLIPGAYEWVGVMHPEPAAVPAVVKRRLVFVRVEVLEVEGRQ